MSIWRLVYLGLLLLALGTPPASLARSAEIYPTVAEVNEIVRGSDDFDTALRQYAIYDALEFIVNQRRLDYSKSQRPPNESVEMLQRVLVAYGTEKARLRTAFKDRCTPSCVPGRQIALHGLAMERYGSPQQADVALGSLMSREWLADYHARQRVTHAAAKPPPQAPQPRPPAASSFFGDLLAWLFMLVLLALSTYATWWLFTRKTRKARRDRRDRQQSSIDGNVKYWKGLGANEEARQSTIGDIFRANKGDVEISVYECYPQKDFESTTRDDWFEVALQVKRNLAAMTPREREGLRAAYLLLNSNLIEYEKYERFAFAFIHGEGKGNIDRYYYHAAQRFGVNSIAAAAKLYQDQNLATVDAAISDLVSVIDSVKEKSNVNEVVRELGARLRGGSVDGDYWLHRSEIATSMYRPQSAYALRLGTLLDGTPLEFSGPESLITIAPPRTGPAVVLDIKGEIYEKTHRWRQTNVGPVYRFSPLEPMQSNSYNPLTLVRQDPDEIWSDAMSVAQLMIVPNKNATDPFWENEARTLLTAAIAHVCYAEPPDRRPMAKVTDILHGGEAWDDMLIGLRTAVDVRAMVQNANSLMNMNEKTRASVMQTARASLGAWSSPKVERVTQKSDWTPADLRSGRNPTIYLCIDNNQLEANLSIIRVFFGQHIRALTGGRPPEHGSPPILFMLDEMPRLGRMPPIEEAIELGGGFGLKLWMFAQNMSQLEEAYKENARGILGSCGVRLYMSPDHEAAEMLSEQIGYSAGPLQTGRERLVEAAVLAGPQFAESQIVTAKATKPARLKKSFAFDDPELKRRMEMA